MLNKVLLIFLVIVLFIIVLNRSQDIRRLILAPIGIATEKIVLSGTGSMYPTFPKGEGDDPQMLAEQTVATIDMYYFPSGFKIGGRDFFTRPLKRGDIVDFENAKTEEITAEKYNEKRGFVKRLIGLPGDTLEIRDGQVVINGEVLKEPYTALAHSTFGGDFLADCTPLKIPDQKYFVLGDNRKSSSDSRYELGLIDETDIAHVLPYENQLGKYDALWHDPSNDDNPNSRIKLDKAKYVEIINQKRQAKGLTPLKLNEALSKSAALRGANVLKYNDFSFEATKSGYTIKDSMKEAGYWNPKWAEAFIRGYYEADELGENILEFPKWQKFLLDPELDDIGIAEVQGQINGCPTQVIVQQAGGYIPPTYTENEIQSWRNGLESLKKVQDGWASVSSAPEMNTFYQEHKADIDRINQIIAIRIAHIGAIVAKMEANEWLLETEKQYIEEEKILSKEQKELAEKLNK
jgi:signal peptidase I